MPKSDQHPEIEKTFNELNARIKELQIFLPNPRSTGSKDEEQKQLSNLRDILTQSHKARKSWDDRNKIFTRHRCTEEEIRKELALIRKNLKIMEWKVYGDLAMEGERKAHEARKVNNE